jgi:hypothetical protein
MLARLEKLAALRREKGLNDDVDEESALEEASAREWIVGSLLDALTAVPDDLIKRAFEDNGLVGVSTKVTSQLWNIKNE